MDGGQTRTLLLVDDEPAQVRLVTALAARAGWRTVAVADGAAALALLDRSAEPLDAVLIDVWRPAAGGAALVGEIHARRPDLAVVIVTAQASIGLAVGAMRAGARDFLLKPIAPARLFAALEGAACAPAEGDELRPLAEKVGTDAGFAGIVGSAPAMRDALACAAIAARSRGPVLVVGGPGTGKELVARAIHAASSRGRRSAAIVDCAALTPAQIDGALAAAQAAPGGTLILAGIAALGEAGQKALLALIEDDGTDVRVIALAARPLGLAVAAGGFRADLAGALATHEVSLPTLAERRGDIPALARHLLARIVRQPGMIPLDLGDSACTLLAAHDWPGNVRQLHDTLFRAALASEGPILSAHDFPAIARVRTPEGEACAPETAGVELYGADGHLRPLDQIEADIVRLAIGHYRGRMSEVARRLGIGRSTLYRKLMELGLDRAA